MTAEYDLTTLDLDWKLAGQRLRKDSRDDFWPDPIALADIVVEVDTGDGRVMTQLKSYRPRKALAYPVPKANLTTRDSIILRPVDRLVYQALVDRIIPEVDPNLATSVFSHRLRSPKDKWIFRPGVAQWQAFTDAVRQRLTEQPGSYLVATDVAQYFEAIRLKSLRMQMENVLGVQYERLRSVVEVLFACLNGWCPYDGYGLVQNTDPSSFLGNIHLDYVDKAMARDGFPILRYMDDIRIVVQTERDARCALLALVGHLRELGLGLNSAKTSIVGPSDPAYAEHVLVDDPDVAQIETAIAKGTHHSVQSIVPTVFRRAEEMLLGSKVGERVFRFLLNRINSLRLFRELDMPDAHELTDGVLKTLVNRPAETDTFCRYLETAPLNATHLVEIERLLTAEPLCIYEWQNYLLWRVVIQRSIRSEGLVRRAHALLNSQLYGPEAAAAALYLGATGDYTDRKAAKAALRRAPFGLVRRHLQIAVQELHKSERVVLSKELAQEDPSTVALTDYLSGLAVARYVEPPQQAGSKVLRSDDDEAPDVMLLEAYMDGLAQPVYVEQPAPVSLEDLVDAMPSVYA